MDHDKHDVAQLEARITELRSALHALADGKEFEEQIRLLRKPGWTTPAEFLFAMGLADAMIANTKALAGLKQALVAGSRIVNIKQTVA